jgi:hypothetical protein
MPFEVPHLLKKDAKNRSLRVFLEGLAYSVLVAVILVLAPVFKDSHDWGDIDWSRLGFALVQAAVMAVFAYVLRTRLDPSKFPTPLPPAPQPEPADGPGVDERGDIDYGTISFVLLLLTFVGVVLLLFRVHFGG